MTEKRDVTALPLSGLVEALLDEPGLTLSARLADALDQAQDALRASVVHQSGGGSSAQGAFLEVYKATAVGDAIQINIGNGRHGYRIVGPKFGASGSQLLKRVALTKRDATEIARYLAEVTDA